MKRPRRHEVRAYPVRWHAYAVAALLGGAILFGGGGAEGPINNGVIQALSALLLAVLIGSHFDGSRPLPRSAGGAAWTFSALLLLVILQLVPLSPAIWQALPGRDTAVASLQLVGAGEEWRPLSLEPEATRRFGTSLLLPAAIVFGLLGATRRETMIAVRTVIIAAAISAVIGALQLTLGNPQWLTFYDGPNPGAASGVFANANHHATLLVGALLCVAFLIRAERLGGVDSGGRSHGLPFHVGWLAVPFLAVMVLATGARAAVILLVLAVPSVLLVAIGRRSPIAWAAGLAAVVAGVGVAVILSPSSDAASFARNFLSSDESRYAFLPDVIYTMKQFWPWGSGFGSFVPVFALHENLDVAAAGFVNHAHNDLLEWLIEGGLPAALWLAAVAGLLGWRLFRAWSDREQLRGRQFGAVLAGALILALFALHSMVDYPARTAAISAVGALAVGLMFTSLADAPPRMPTSTRPGWQTIAPVLVALVVAAQVMRIHAAQAAVRAGQGAVGVSIRPQNSWALALAAEQQLQAGNAAAARDLAASAIRKAPLTSWAVRVFAMAAPKPEAGLPAWRVASTLGWRDGATQLWALRQALLGEEFEVAAARADAFLRTRSKPPGEYVGLIRVMANAPPFRAALRDRLLLDPPWRRLFFRIPEGADEQQVRGAHAMLQSLAEAGELRREDTIRTLQELVRRRDFVPALALYRRVSDPPEPGELLTDLDFSRSGGEYLEAATPFDWNFTRASAGGGSIEEVDGSRVLVVETDGQVAYQAVRRLVALPPGRYALTYRIRGPADAPEGIAIAARCATQMQLLGSTSAAPLQGSDFETRRLTFSVPSDCPLIQLAFEAKAVGHPADAEIDLVSFRRVDGR